MATISVCILIGEAQVSASEHFMLQTVLLAKL